MNCHVIVAASLLAMFDNFVEVTLEDNIPQVNQSFPKVRNNVLISGMVILASCLVGSISYKMFQVF